MQQVFRNAFLFSEPTVLNRKLRPLCCGHLMIMMASDNPYTKSITTPKTLIHLAFAVGVCSRTFEEAEAWMASPAILDDVRKWGKTCRKLDFNKEAERFEDYIVEYSTFPLRAKGSVSPQGGHHPWPLVIATTLLPMVGESRAWNMPLPRAISHWSAYRETQGDSSLVSDWEIEALAKMKRDKEQKEKEIKTNEK